jgi:hypothetical protein
MAISVEYQPERKRGKYPWNKWEDGQAWLVIRGRDYNVSDDAFRASLRIRARNSGKQIDVEVFKTFPIQLLTKAGIALSSSDVGGMVFKFSSPPKKMLKR